MEGKFKNRTEVGDKETGVFSSLMSKSQKNDRHKRQMSIKG